MDDNEARDDAAAGRLTRRALLAGAVSVPLVATAGAAYAGERGRGRDPHSVIELPATPDHGIARWQPFDNNIADPAVLAGTTNFVWHNSVWTDQQLPEGMIGSGYIAGDLNWPLGRDLPEVYTLAWFEEHHPDWVVYREDRVTPAWRGAPPEPGGPQRIPLDMANPAVRQFMAMRNVAPALSQTVYGEPLRENHSALAVDLVQLMNVLRKDGTYTEDGTWVKRFVNSYSGLTPSDPPYSEWWLGWLRWLRNWLHARGHALALNIGDNQWQLDKIGRTVPEDVLATQRAAIDIADIWVSEFVVYPASGNVGLAWENQLQLIWEHTSAGKPFCAASYLPLPVAQADPQDVEWAIAYYFLYKGPGTMLAVHGKNLGTGLRENGSWVDRPELHTDIGVADGPPRKDSSGAWWRPYARGLAVVNPSASEPAVLTLPPGSWADLAGVTHTGTIVVPPARGYVLETV